jgi:hypothetical protein
LFRPERRIYAFAEKFIEKVAQMVMEVVVDMFFL